MALSTRLTDRVVHPIISAPMALCGGRPVGIRRVGPRMHVAALAASGDDTIRSRVMDLVRWHGREAELMAVADEETA